MKINKLMALIFFLISPVLINAGEITPQKYIIVVAMKSEIAASGIDKYAPVIYTGLGKVNAAIKLYEAILDYKPELVINYGTAGAVKKGVSGLFHVETFVQRDMDVRALGFKRGVTPFSNRKLPKIKGIVLGTGDSFVTNTKKQLEGLTVRIDLVDMEGYALKEVADHMKIQFKCYKNVSDSADSKAKDDWEKNIIKGAKLFKKVLNEKYGVSKLKWN
ncbi:MAG: 5'-methylthioadenosine nucleosidase [Desulfobacterales bacterium]|nr:5'-methylthioadenosine nucleosidase [Desulfobacterales bacterium]MCP4159293.1 5'-methylthioadenosine nucleosidase [Deltaproteobacteria bacterium]